MKYFFAARNIFLFLVFLWFPVVVTEAKSTVLTTFSDQTESAKILQKDASGNVYAATQRSVTSSGSSLYYDSIFKIDVTGNKTLLYQKITSLSHVYKELGLYVNASGTSFITVSETGEVVKVLPSGATSTFAWLGSTGKYFHITGDINGNLYTIAQAPGSNLTKITPFGATSTLAYNFNTSQGLSVDLTGNIFISSSDSLKVFKVTQAGASSTFASGLLFNSAPAVDSSGNVYVTAADGSNYRVMKYSSIGTSTTLFISASPTSRVIALDQSDNAYVGTYFSENGKSAYDRIIKFTTAGASSTFGYVDSSVSSVGEIPSAMIFDSNNNLISSSYAGRVIKTDNTSVAPSQPVDVYAYSFDGFAKVIYQNVSDGGINNFSGEGPYNEIRDGGFNGGQVTYTITSNPGGISVSTTSKSVVITGLTNGTPYTFSVSASNSNGMSPLAVTNVTTPSVSRPVELRTLLSGSLLSGVNDKYGNTYIASYEGNIEKVSATGTESIFYYGRVTSGDFMEMYLDKEMDILYVVSDADSVILKINILTLATSTISIPTSYYGGIALDSNKNVYLLDQGNGKVLKVLPSGSYSDFYSSSNYLASFIFDKNDNLYIGETSVPDQTGVGSITKVTPQGDFIIYLIPHDYVGNTNPYNLAIDSLNNIYVSTWPSTALFKLTPAGNFTKVLPLLTGNLPNIYIDGNDSVYVLSYSYSGPQSYIMKVLASGIVSMYADVSTSTMTSPQFLIRDASGNFYVTDEYDNVIFVSAPPDLTFPSISITSPASATNVTGSTTITATASDDVWIKSVTFYASSTPLGSEILYAPYSLSFSPPNGLSGLTNLYAVARDISDNSATTSVTVVFPVSSISSITSISTSTTATSATFSYVTDQLGSTFAQYSTTSPYVITTGESDLSPRVTHHSLTIPSLVPCSTYHVSLASTDMNGVTATSSDLSVTTAGCTQASLQSSQVLSGGGGWYNSGVSTPNGPSTGLSGERPLSSSETAVFIKLPLQDKIFKTIFTIYKDGIVLGSSTVSSVTSAVIDICKLQTVESKKTDSCPYKSGTFMVSTEVFETGTSSKKYLQPVFIPVKSVLGDQTASLVSQTASITVSVPPTQFITSIKKNLSQGSTGNDVINLQTYLIASYPHYFSSGTIATGYFGSQTIKAVQELQCDLGIICSGSPKTTGWGVFGPKTRKAIKG